MKGTMEKVKKMESVISSNPLEKVMKVVYYPC